jgi:Kef-type K+ transport system membrane component KefB
MTGFITFFIILAASIFFSVIFRKLHLPWVVALIAAGVVIGPFGLGVFDPSGTFQFLADIGLVFLMFMAGLEIRLSSLSKVGGKVSKVAITNAVVTFLVGLAVAFAFGYGLSAALLLGVVLISSSVSVVVPLLEGNRLLSTGLGRTIVGTAVIKDIASLIFLSILLQATDAATALPLPVFYLLFTIALVVLRLLYPKLKKLFTAILKEPDPFEKEVRIVFAILIGTVVIFELLGLHPIVAGFFSGLVLSESLESRILHEKLHSLSYGLFIPIFFIVVGANTDIGALFTLGEGLVLIGVVVFGSMISTFGSGYLGAKLVGFTNTESSLVGGAMVPQLSTTLAASFAGLSFGIIDASLATAIVILSIVSTLVGTLIISFYSRKVQLSFSSSEADDV